MKLFIKSLAVVLIFTAAIQAQVNYYAATGKDSITYLATNLGLIVMTRQQDGHLQYHSYVNDSNKTYSRALDNDSFLAMGTNSFVDIYSLENKHTPRFIGSIAIPDIKSIRPFGEHFAVLRGDGIKEQFIIGVVNDTLRKITGIETNSLGYSGRTLWYPEVVYPYMFSYINDTQLLMHRFDEATEDFIFIDTLTVAAGDYKIIQLYGGADYIFVSAAEYSNSNWTIKRSRYTIVNDTIYYVDQNITTGNIFFTDEIECTNKLVRFNAQYATFTGQNLNEPNGYLSGYTNLSGDKIYNTRPFGLPANSKFYYSTGISGTVINSAELIINPSSLEDHHSDIDYALNQNYPNPFNPSTTIKYAIKVPGTVSLRVFDMLGREIITLVDEHKTPGSYSIEFDGSNLTSSVYFYRIESNDYSETKKMLLIK